MIKYPLDNAGETGIKPATFAYRNTSLMVIRILPIDIDADRFSFQYIAQFIT